MEVELVPPGGEDAALWHAWRGEEASRRFNPLHDAPVDELAARMGAESADLSDRESTEFRWMVRADGETIGTVAAFNVSWPMGYAELGYMIGAAYHRRGLGTRAVSLLVDRLFAETDLHRVFATVSVDNEASIRLLRRLGFVEEGRLREHHRIEGRKVDQVVMGLLRAEWD